MKKVVELLPFEILELIFSFLSDDDIDKAEQVCQSWSTVIVNRFWWKRLLCFHQEDACLRKELARMGFDPCHSDQYAVNRFAYRKVISAWESNWKEIAPWKMSQTLKVGTAAEFVLMKVHTFVPYMQQKVFVFLETGSIEVWTFGDDILKPLTFKQRIYDCQSDFELMEVPGRYPVSAIGSLIITLHKDRQRLMFIDAESEKTIGEYPSPLASIYGLAINRHHFFFLSRWSLAIVAYDIDLDGSVGSGDMAIIPDAQPSYDGGPELNWCESHKLEVNDEFIVTLTSYPKRLGSFAKTTSIRVRKTKNPKKVLHQLRTQQGTEIFSFKVSSAKENVLAVLEDNIMHSVLKVYDLETMNIHQTVSSLFGSLNDTLLPVQWMNDRLFAKAIPRSQNDDEVSLMVVDYKTKNISEVSGLRMKTPNDILFFNYFEAMMIYNNIPTTAIGEEHKFEVNFELYKFWK